MTEVDAWQLTDELMKKNDQSGGLWLKFAGNGDKAVVVFLGKPYPREVSFVNGKYVLADAKTKAEGHKVAVRVAFNVALFDTKEIKVIELGQTLYKDLVRVREKYGLTGWAFEIERHGAAKDPKTTYSLLPEKQLTSEEQAAFGRLKEHELAKLYATEPEESEAVEPFGSYDEAPSEPVSPAEAQALIEVLKQLPREDVTRFTEHFRIQRVRELRASELGRAQAFLTELKRGPAASMAPAEVNPFG